MQKRGGDVFEGLIPQCTLFIPLFVEKLVIPLLTLTTIKTAYQKLIAVKFSYKQYNRHRILHEAWSTNTWLFIVKILNFLQIKFFDKVFCQKFPIPTFYNSPFLTFLHSTLRLVFILAVTVHLGNVLSLPFTEGEWKWQEDIKSCMILKINPEITKIGTIPAKLTMFTWFWSL